MTSKIKRILYRASSRLRGKAKIIEARSSSIFSAAPSLVKRIRLPNNPDKVKKAKHTSPPLHFPDSTAEQDEIRYFLYTLLTTEDFGIYKLYPQWILETCWAWTGNGGQLLRMKKKDLMDICPYSSGYAGIDPKKHKVEDIVPPAARRMIGQALVFFRNKQEQDMANKRNGPQPHAGRIPVASMDSITAPPVTMSRSLSTRPVSIAPSVIEAHTDAGVPQSLTCTGSIVRRAGSVRNTISTYDQQQQPTMDVQNNLHLPSTSRRPNLPPIQTNAQSYQSVNSCASPSNADTAASTRYSLSTNVTSPPTSTNKSPLGRSSASSDNSSPDNSLTLIDPTSPSAPDEALRSHIPIVDDLKAQIQDSLRPRAQRRSQSAPARYKRTPVHHTGESVKRAFPNSREATQHSTYVESSLESPGPLQHHLDPHMQQSLSAFQYSIPNYTFLNPNANSNAEPFTHPSLQYQEVNAPSLNQSYGFPSPQMPDRFTLPSYTTYFPPLQPIPEGQLREQNHISNAQCSGQYSSYGILYPQPTSTYGFQHMQQMYSPPCSVNGSTASRHPASSIRHRSMSPPRSIPAASTRSDRSLSQSERKILAASILKGRPSIVSVPPEPTEHHIPVLVSHVEQRKSSDTRMSKERLRTISSETMRTISNDDEYNGPSMRFVNPETGLARKTLVEEIEERQQRDRKRQKGVDRDIPGWHKYR